MRRVLMPWTTLVATTDVNSKKFFPATGWLRAADVARVKAIWEQISGQTNFRAAFAYQVANSVDTPAPVYELGATLAADATSYGTLTSVSANTNGSVWVRFGWNVWYNAGGTPPLVARVGGSVDYLET
jgi:hypothetical protein